jgi:tellurite methyltransferase
VEHRELLEAQPRGRAVDVACGRGRNTLLLADLGFDVDAVDISGVAVERVQARTAGRAGAVHGVRADVTTTPLPRPPYDVVLDIDFLERSILGTLRDALAPGGLLVFETFTSDHPTMNPAFTLEPNELLRAFAGLRVLSYREADGRAALVGRAPS